MADDRLALDSYDRTRRTVAVRCVVCRWKFRCATEQLGRPMCRACETRHPNSEPVKVEMPFHKKPDTDRSYLAFIRRQPCCVCGGIDVEAHHIRLGSLEHDSNPGGAQRAEDKWALPLCNRHHREVHEGEAEFWASLGINPHKLALRYQMMTR